MLMPYEKSAVSMSWRVKEMMIWNACKIVLATDRLTPALRWSQTTSIDVIFTISRVGSEISDYLSVKK
jgi:hypothetical protein